MELTTRPIFAFFLGKYEILTSEVCSTFSFTKTVEECATIPLVSLICLPQLCKVKNEKTMFFHSLLMVTFGYGNSYQGGNSC